MEEDSRVTCNTSISNTTNRKIENSQFNQTQNKQNTISKGLSLYGRLVYVSKDQNLKYSPISNRKINSDYDFTETLYDVVVSPTKILIGTDKKTGVQYAIKQVNKSKLNSSLMLEFIYNEFELTKYLCSNCEYIIKVYDYYEDENYLYLIMELCDRPHFFEELLENVS